MDSLLANLRNLRIAHAAYITKRLGFRPTTAKQLAFALYKHIRHNCGTQSIKTMSIRFDFEYKTLHITAKWYRPESGYRENSRRAAESISGVFQGSHSCATYDAFDCKGHYNLEMFPEIQEELEKLKAWKTLAGEPFQETYTFGIPAFNEQH